MARACHSNHSKLNDSLKTLTSQSDSLTSGRAQAVYSSLPATQRAIVDATDKIAGKDFTQISFASDENMDIGLVQFAMKTEAISIDDDDDEEETVEENKSFVQKLKDLF